MSNRGNARASRAGDGALGIANCSADVKDSLSDYKTDCGEAPQSAREARALPRVCRTIMQAFAVLFFASVISSCETTNYVPPLTPQMAAANLRNGTQVDAAKLDEGRRLFVHRCIECHTLPPVWKYSREDWPDIVNDMSHRSSLKPAERDAVLAYILAVRANER